MSNRYVEALRRIPAGETRSFSELAAMAGRPGAARAAGRAVRGCTIDARLPWHRVVSADGGLVGDEARTEEQLARLRREGARPRDGESLRAWIRRRGIAWVGKLPERVYAAAGDARATRWRELQVEPLADEPSALARGFVPIDGEPPTPIDLRPRKPRAVATPAPPLGPRLRALDRNRALDLLVSSGFFKVPALLTPAECESILVESASPDRFDRRVEMLPKGYGVGVYRYWNEPLPEPLGELRATLFEWLAPIAAPFRAGGYPSTLRDFWRECRTAGQRRPSSILIQYPAGGVNHPHRDLYGRVWFPYQALAVLSRGGRDFDGGEFVLMEEHPDGDLRHEIPVGEGDLVVFGSRERLERRGGRRCKVPLLHAMNTVTRGRREAVGIVFHLAE